MAGREVGIVPIILLLPREHAFIAPSVLPGAEAWMLLRDNLLLQ
jgi:hypothetical protein